MVNMLDIKISSQIRHHQKQTEHWSTETCWTNRWHFFCSGFKGRL